MYMYVHVYTVVYSAVYLTPHSHISISNSTEHVVQYRITKVLEQFTDNLQIGLVVCPCP